MTEECLFSLITFNLKRMVKAFFSLLSSSLIHLVGRGLFWNDYFVNSSNG